MSLSIEELLESLANPAKIGGLENNADTWRRIRNKDSFEELGLDSSELENFLKEWVAENPYSNLK